MQVVVVTPAKVPLPVKVVYEDAKVWQGLTAAEGKALTDDGKNVADTYASTPSNVELHFRNTVQALFNSTKAHVHANRFLNAQMDVAIYRKQLPLCTIVSNIRARQRHEELPQIFVDSVTSAAKLAADAEQYETKHPRKRSFVPNIIEWTSDNSGVMCVRHKMISFRAVVDVSEVTSQGAAEIVVRRQAYVSTIVLEPQFGRNEEFEKYVTNDVQHWVDRRGVAWRFDPVSTQVKFVKVETLATIYDFLYMRKQLYRITEDFALDRVPAKRPMLPIHRIFQSLSTVWVEGLDERKRHYGFHVPLNKFVRTSDGDKHQVVFVDDNLSLVF